MIPSPWTEKILDLVRKLSRSCSANIYFEMGHSWLHIIYGLGLWCLTPFSKIFQLYVAMNDPISKYIFAEQDLDNFRTRSNIFSVHGDRIIRRTKKEDIFKS